MKVVVTNAVNNPRWWRSECVEGSLRTGQRPERLKDIREKRENSISAGEYGVGIRWLVWSLGELSLHPSRLLSVIGRGLIVGWLFPKKNPFTERFRSLPGVVPVLTPCSIPRGLNRAGRDHKAWSCALLYLVVFPAFPSYPTMAPASAGDGEASVVGSCR